MSGVVSRCAVAFFALAALGGPGIARASTSDDTCTGFITTLPFRIDQPGVWCLSQDLALDDPERGSAIYLNVNHVVLDCRGHRLDGTGAGLYTHKAGVASFLKRGIVVRRCVIEGFARGIDITTNSSGFPETDSRNLIEDNVLIGNRLAGIEMSGANDRILRNRVIDTGDPARSGIGSAILYAGSGEVTGNTIDGYVAPQNGAALSLSGDVVVRDNRIRRVVHRLRADVASLIFIGSGSKVSVQGNQLHGGGGAGIFGVRCYDDGYGRMAGVRGNMMVGLSGAVSVACQDLGGNYLGGAPVAPRPDLRAGTRTPVVDAESDASCTGFIDAVPVTIADEGRWCLRGTLVMPQGLPAGTPAITLAGDEQTLDCNRYRIAGLPGYVGIVSSSSHATVRRCSLDGFDDGILLDGDYAVVEDNSLDAIRRHGIRVGGHDGLVRGNHVATTRGPMLSGGRLIRTEGTTDVLDNRIDHRPGGYGNGGYALQTSANAGGMVRGNVLGRMIRQIWGIRVDGGSTGVMVVDNFVGKDSLVAVSCAASGSVARDNMLGRAVDDAASCADAGNNSFLPP